jgi:hypothetical protein
MRRYHLRLMLLPLVLLLCVGSMLGAADTLAATQPTPSVVFNLTVSLEWEPGATDRLPDDLALSRCPDTTAKQLYLDDLKAGLRQTAAYLYAYSEGQMALGSITVYTGGVHWDDANLRVLASNAERPTAFVGGIVGTPTRNISATTGISGTVFYPGTITLGRLWNGLGSRCGSWSQPAGWRTIGHEWAHYALYLYDEYFNADTGAEQYCTTTGFSPREILPTVSSGADSLMAYQYSADKLWLRGAAPPHTAPPWSCIGTPQDRVHGATDWQTIKRFYPTITIPAALRTDIQFAGSPAEPLFNVTIVAPPTPRNDTSAEVRLAALPTPRLVGQAYLIRPGPTSGFPQRIIGQGEMIPGEPAPLPFWGVQQDTSDRAEVVVQDWTSGVRACFPQHYDTAPPLDPAATNPLSASTSVWRPGLTITPRVTEIGGISEVTGLIVRLEDCANRTKHVEVVYCPAGGDCGMPILMPGPDTSGAFSYTFSFPFDGVYDPPAPRGYIYVRNIETLEESVTWYQLAGGVGPAALDGHAPLAEGAVETDPEPGKPQPGADTRLLYSPAQRCAAGGFGLPPGILGIAGTPFDVQPVVADANGGRPWNSARGDPPLRVRLNYSQDLLDRLGIGEHQLVVLHLQAGQCVWQVVPTIGQSDTLDWIAAAAQPFAGQGEVYALGYVPARVWLPLIRRGP